MVNRRVAAPLRVTERADYGLKSVLLLSGHEGEFLTAKVVADHYGLSTKMLASVLWNLRAAGILESRPGWHGGFRLARSARTIALSAVIAAAIGDDVTVAGGLTHIAPNSSTAVVGERAEALVDRFWAALDDHVQRTLASVTVADLARETPLGDLTTTNAGSSGGPGGAGHDNRPGSPATSDEPPSDRGGTMLPGDMTGGTYSGIGEPRGDG